jgi:riboflavin kinase/FMN adenylyltransferase
MVQPLAVIEGTVVHGKHLGSAMGIPTANIPYPKGTVVAPDGVYVADAVLMDQGGRVVQGVLNQGYHPTVPDGDPAVEMHLFDFDENLYGQRVRIRYLHFLRPEETFDSKEEMRLVMMDDLKRARQWFAENPDYIS